ncbi:SigE family RNA polymerase sigma factor [Nocardioides iriomotensis]|uniref:SigE family RNA polymerase sigma factor n=1 Tax=Nocardioides iriomotensis TaxID=715784 RepID=A0A4Q5IXV0_9ACTN|nr:SigE family RNA polymerase sigma factor [Nocardioides iriomotensis]RYU11007.1 SigE family RNA polymerase sigma factor [Nocardioides iriomotensis]
MRGSVRDREFTEYVAARRPQLRRTAYLLCGDSHRAEDLVQVALTKLYVAWPRVRRDANVDAFARRIVVNSHLDETRRPWRRERTGLDGIDVASPPPLPPEDRDALLAALQQLPAGQRRVVVLRHYWGLTVQEAADDLGVTTGTVKSQTSAALDALHRLLSPSFEDTPDRRSRRAHR